MGRPFKQYPQELVGVVAHLYTEGYTQKEIAERIGRSRKVVWRVMRNHGIKPRPAIRRRLHGPRNPNWRGEHIGYAGGHRRVQVARGKPKECSNCKTTDPNATYDWANLSGNYADPDDYTRLCRSCHWTRDGIVNNLRGG
jgi:hypothetical protein